MGNIGSSWIHRRRSQDEQNTAPAPEGDRSRAGEGETFSRESEIPSRPASSTTRYALRRRPRFRDLRQTLFQRTNQDPSNVPGQVPSAESDSLNNSNHERPVDRSTASTSSLASTASSRRRGRDDTQMPSENEPQPRRTRTTPTPAPTPSSPLSNASFVMPPFQVGMSPMLPINLDLGEGDDASSLYFYFFLPLSPTPGTTTTATTGAETADDRRSRLRRSFSHFVREHLTRASPSPADSASAQSVPVQETTSPSAENSQLVIVRMRRLPVPEQDGQFFIQWTIYFVMARSPEEAARNGPPSAQETQEAMNRAFAMLGAMMSGENMGYEEWIRLQDMLGSVSRGVSSELIEAQLPQLSLSDLDLLKLEPCPICLTPFVIEEKTRKLPCGHLYHSHCIDNWLRTVNSCPLCRQVPVTREPQEP